MAQAQEPRTPDRDGPDQLLERWVSISVDQTRDEVVVYDKETPAAWIQSDVYADAGEMC